MRILKILAALFAALLVLLGIAYLFRSDPIGPIAGKRLSGPEAPWPDDWSFSEEINLAAVEVRPDDPHSVTTIHFVYDGTLHVPARDGSTKSWTQYVQKDPRVRVKLGERVFLGRATRVTDESETEAITAAIRKKYARLMPADDGSPPPEDVWMFRIDPR